MDSSSYEYEESSEQISPNTVDPLSAHYLDYLVADYKEVIDGADDIEVLADWIPQVLPDDPELDQIIDNISLVDVETAKSMILYILKSKVLALVLDEPHISPWVLSNARDKTCTRLFGAPEEKLEIVIHKGEKKYKHMLTEDFTYGLVVALHKSKFEVSLYGAVITIDMLPQCYLLREAHGTKVYKVCYVKSVYYFKTPKFLQGLKTGAEWLEQDVSKLVKKFCELTNDTECEMDY